MTMQKQKKHQHAPYSHLLQVLQTLPTILLPHHLIYWSHDLLSACDILKFGQNQPNSTGNMSWISLTHCSRETRKRVTGKQCGPRSDATECGV